MKGGRRLPGGWLGPGTLRRRMTVGVSIIVAGMSLLMYLHFPHRLETQAMAAVSDKAKSLSDMAAYTLAAAVYFNDPAEIAEALKGLEADDQVAWVVVRDTMGTVLGAIAPERAEAAAFDDRQTMSRSADGGVLRVQAPIEYLDTRVGTVHLGLGLARVQQAVAATRRQVAGLAVGAFLVAILGVLALGALVERLERRNRDLAARFRAVFDSSDLGMAMVDGEGVITEDNHALRSMTGVPDLPGHHLVELLSPPDARLVGRWMAELRDGTRDTIRGEVKATRRSEEDGWWHLTLSGTSDAQGEPGLAMAILEDITDRRQLEAQLVQAQKMEAIGRLAGGVAHDFNNLLTTINGTASMALTDLDDRSPVKGDLDEILKAGQRAASLTSQLLAFSRRQMMQQKVVDLNTVIADTATMLRRMIGEDVRLHLELSHSVPPVLVDPGQIGQVLMNLAVNARDAMPGGGDLWIETDSLDVGDALSGRLGTSRRGRHAILRVRDNGQGMDETTRSMVFEPFFTTKPVGKGTGLGLPMVYGIVKQSSGGIAVESAPGAGTTFTIALPERIESSTGKDGGGVDEEVTLTTGSGTVLLVEDEDGVRSLVSRVLRRAGYRVLEADGSEAAIQVASRHDGPLDALVTDVVMPDMGGPELARALTAMRPSLRVLFVSGYTKSEVLPAEELEGGVAFLAKPMAPADLTRTLATLLE